MKPTQKKNIILKAIGNGTVGVKDHFDNQDFDDLLVGFEVNTLI